MFEHRDTVSGKGSELTPCMGVSMYTNSTAVLLTENVDQQKVRETESKAHFIFFIFSSFLPSPPFILTLSLPQALSPCLSCSVCYILVSHWRMAMDILFMIGCLGMGGAKNK